MTQYDELGNDTDETCPLCGQMRPYGICEAPGCRNPADWEGWVRNDHLIQRRRLCEHHKCLFIGHELERALREQGK